MHSTKVKTRLLPSLSLLVLLLAACAPAAVAPEPSGEQPVAPVAAEATPTPFAPVDPATEEVAAPTEEVAADPLPVATSRGDNLQASTPSDVNLASGGLQFVEFFRFT
ncbi:MAG TPA: hypothetical protein VLA72_01590 [Anaerolineales bacterium]|nr:hypothetical protein [Anaerolineales bacterium]